MFYPRGMEGLERDILAILREHPAGVGEFFLLSSLEERYPQLFSGESGDPDFDLFQRHFLLFHLLYILGDKLYRKGDLLLSIHCLEIKLVSREAAAGCEGLSPYDPLRSYYLDITELDRVDGAAVRAMLDDFYRRYHAYLHREDDLKLLGLEVDADLGEVEQRYRQLALEHHPDCGGDAELFARIGAAVERLRDRRSVADEEP